MGETEKWTSVCANKYKNISLAFTFVFFTHLQQKCVVNANISREFWLGIKHFSYSSDGMQGAVRAVTRMLGFRGGGSCVCWVRLLVKDQNKFPSMGPPLSEVPIALQNHL